MTGSFLGTPDGLLAKNDKSTMVAYLTSDVEPAASPPQDGKTFFIDDGNARLHALKDRPDTFQLISLKLLQQLPPQWMCYSQPTCI